MEVNVMTSEETARLAELEAVIKKDLKGFVRVGRALKEIKEKKLYRGKYATWKDYLKNEWDISKSNGNYHIRASEIIGILENGHSCGRFEGVKFSPPRNEAQARPLGLLSDDDGKLNEEQILEAWKEVMQQTNGRATALVITKVVQNHLEAQLDEEKKGLQKNLPKEVNIPEDFSEQFNRLIEVLSMHRKGGWKEFNRKKALEYLHALEEYLNS